MKDGNMLKNTNIIHLLKDNGRRCIEKEMLNKLSDWQQEEFNKAILAISKLEEENNWTIELKKDSNVEFLEARQNWKYEYLPESISSYDLRQLTKISDVLDINHDGKQFVVNIFISSELKNHFEERSKLQ